MIDSKQNPPLLQDYTQLLNHSSSALDVKKCVNHEPGLEERELPVVDLSSLWSPNENQRASCASEICKASAEWGFFQIINHGISLELLRKMRKEQVELFKAPFEQKSNSGLLDNSYRYGNKTATCPKQLSWCEAFHVPLTKISDNSCYGEFNSLREVMQEYASAMQQLANLIAKVLVMNMGVRKGEWEDKCDASTCFMRLNRYPPCPISSEVFGLVPHTDSDFLTILHQDEHVGGLQLMKDSKWMAVKPNPDALVVNIGDLFQAWSNDVYKSVEHKVMVNREVERHSIAYFLCPSYESIIGCCDQEKSTYRKFTFGEYRSQIQQDVRAFGHKVGLPRFLVSNRDTSMRV
ncbi:gibberellin 2-beta-dioxygenase 8-like [Rutidosis leptorrhynchoides]|uniref:gibberellin 2-beta-dioxygenase 8-like n=1 Tax=Rutidosis leptorrhynchoides TaxID=125765 RepID=UPI003A99FBD0